MEVYYESARDEKLFNSEKRIRKTWPNLAEKIKNRIAALRAAETLNDVSTLPPLRCHLLTGDKTGCFAVNIDEKYRLVFKPLEYDEAPSGGIDKKTVKKITVLGVTNYHAT